jgi:hypothetical protein
MRRIQNMAVGISMFVSLFFIVVFTRMRKVYMLALPVPQLMVFLNKIGKP